MLTPASFEGERKMERRLSAELYDHADGRAGGSLMFADGKHIFEREAAEVEPVAGVISRSIPSPDCN